MGGCGGGSAGSDKPGSSTADTKKNATSEGIATDDSKAESKTGSSATGSSATKADSPKETTGGSRAFVAAPGNAQIVDDAAAADGASSVGLDLPEKILYMLLGALIAAAGIVAYHATMGKCSKV